MEEIIISIEKMENEERKKLLNLIKEKYNLINKLPEKGFKVGRNYDFWLCEEDDIYDKLYDEQEKK